MDTAAVVTRDAAGRLGRAGFQSARFPHEISSRVRSVVPHDVPGWLMLDPDTMLPSATLENEKATRARAYWRNELLASDVHKPGDLARQPSPAAVLRQLDAPAAARSERVQLICGQAGIGDELRLLLRADGVACGAAQFCRESGSPHFDDAERGFIADLAPEIGAGLRWSLSHLCRAKTRS